VSSLAALPAPSAVGSSSSGPTAIRRALSSDAAPVQAIRATTAPARKAPDAVEDYDARRASSTSATSERGVASGNGAFQIGVDGGTSAARSVSPTGSTVSSAAFVTQSLSQEVIGAGLHIEPWNDAINAYSRADAGAAVGGRSGGTSFVV